MDFALNGKQLFLAAKKNLFYMTNILKQAGKLLMILIPVSLAILGGCSDDNPVNNNGTVVVPTSILIFSSDSLSVRGTEWHDSLRIDLVGALHDTTYNSYDTLRIDFNITTNDTNLHICAFEVPDT